MHVAICTMCFGLRQVKLTKTNGLVLEISCFREKPGGEVTEDVELSREPVRLGEGGSDGGLGSVWVSPPAASLRTHCVLSLTRTGCRCSNCLFRHANTLVHPQLSSSLLPPAVAWFVFLFMLVAFTPPLQNRAETCECVLC